MPAKNSYQKKLAYNNEYNRENYRSFSIRYNKKSEAKIIKWLEKKESVKSYINALIEADMKKAANKKKKAKK